MESLFDKNEELEEVTKVSFSISLIDLIFSIPEPIFG
jgi:hypothetical protein